ncbi:MAG: hypothetical protein Q8936_25110, partial [Bacillota bacterium]|nr:hypothetical protein [Bacillota bacterium]
TPENSIQTSSTGDSVTVKGKGVDYPFNDMDVTAVFSLAGNDVVLVMTAAGDENWVFTNSFPPLEGTIADYMKFEEDQKPTIILSSHNQGDNQTGMCFDGVINLNAMSKGLSELLKIPNQHVTGTVTMGDNGSDFQGIELNGPDITGVNLGIASDCQVSFKIGCELIPNLKKTDYTAIPYIGMITTLPFTAKGVKHNLKLCVQVSSFSNPIRFAVDMNESIDAAVDELKALTANSGFDGLLPSNFELGNYVTFDDLFFDYSLETNKVEFISMGVANASEWTIAQINGTDKALVVKELALRLMVDDPFGTKAVAASMEGEVALGDSAVMCVYGRCPNWEIGGYLKKDSVLKVKELADLFIGESNGIPDILIDILDFKLSSKSYSLNTRLKDLWTITSGDSTIFAIDEVVLSINHTSATKETQAKFYGVLDVAGIRLNLEADYATSGGFKFTGST